MRTVAYVDGYNLYYGCLKGSSYLWLDIGRLVQNVLHIQNPATELVRVKYFTAYIKARFASHGDASAQAQQTYFKALRASATLISRLAITRWSHPGGLTTASHRTSDGGSKSGASRKSALM